MTDARVKKIEALAVMSPMISFLSIELGEFDDKNLTASFLMPMRSEFERIKGAGQYHGGAVLAFADTVGDFAVAYLVGGLVPTMNFRMDFLRPATGPALSAVAKVRKLGRTVAVVDVEVSDTSSKLIALGRGSYSAAIG